MDTPLPPRPGLWSKFPKPKKYLEKFELGPIGALETRDWERQELPRLTRFAAGERFSFTYGGLPPGVPNEPMPYLACTAGSDLRRLAHVEQYFAIQAALRDEAGWMERWRKSVAYLNWALRIDYRWHQHAQTEFERGIRPQRLAMLSLLGGLGACVGHCISLGWLDLGAELAKRAFDAIDRGWCGDGGDDYGRRRTQHFVLNLVADSQGWPARTTPRCAHDEPVFETLLRNWRTADASSLEAPILYACDRHTHQCRYDNAKGEFFDLPVESWYTPFEILTLYRLRENAQLPLPRVEHPLLNTPVGRLPERQPIWSDPLLEGVLTRVRAEFPDL